MSDPDLAYEGLTMSALGDDLATITTRLKDDEKRLGGFGVEDVAHRKVSDAIDHFAGDWDDKRNKLVKKVEALSVMVTKSGEKFDEADRELADSLVSGEEQ
jgi:hypothetical protein